MELKNLKETHIKSTDVNVWKHRSIWSDVKKNSIPALSALSYLKSNGIERLDGCVDKLYTTDDWLIKKSVEINNAKKLMIEKEPKLEDLFKSYGISVE